LLAAYRCVKRSGQRLIVHAVLLYISEAEALFNHFHGGAEHLNFSALFVQNVNIVRNKKDNIMKCTAFCGGEKEKILLIMFKKNQYVG